MDNRRIRETGRTSLTQSTRSILVGINTVLKDNPSLTTRESRMEDPRRESSLIQRETSSIEILEDDGVK
ncbi:MAG: hypothetical protein Ct9H90mP9_5760 [Pseudomonadota bacterium]|nr:MAG: hypothetical protein Ct9H90mP9_5760 [Pseudomonadota bacterium]